MRHHPNSSKSVEQLRRYGDLTVFENGDRPPSWICWAHNYGTHEEYLVVFVVGQKIGQNLVVIDAVVSIPGNIKLSIFARLA